MNTGNNNNKGRVVRGLKEREFMVEKQK